MDHQDGKTDQPSTRRKRRAGVVVAGIVLAIVVVIFVGYNISHVKISDQQQKSGDKEYTGLN